MSANPSWSRPPRPHRTHKRSTRPETISTCSTTVATRPATELERLQQVRLNAERHAIEASAALREAESSRASPGRRGRGRRDRPQRPASRRPVSAPISMAPAITSVTAQAMERRKRVTEQEPPSPSLRPASPNSRPRLSRRELNFSGWDRSTPARPTNLRRSKLAGRGLRSRSPTLNTPNRRLAKPNVSWSN